MKVAGAIINVPAGAGSNAWAACFRKTADRADIFGINESLRRKQRKLYRREARKRGLRACGLFRGPNPLFHDPMKWRRLHAAQHKLHGPGPRRFRLKWPGFNAARYATVAVYKSRRIDDLDVTVINTHWVPRGPKVPDAWRNEARAQAIRKVAALVRDHHALGRVVVVIGDLNMADAPDLPGIRWIRDAGVDKVGVACPAGWELAGRDVDTYEAPTDHKHGIRFRITIQEAA